MYTDQLTRFISLKSWQLLRGAIGFLFLFGWLSATSREIAVSGKVVDVEVGASYPT